MGALHAGHFSLLRRCRKEQDVVVLSIFVNPTQFGPNEDYQTYPRTFKKDLALARKAGVDIVFYPAVQDMYPEEFATFVDVPEPLTRTLCGKSRPGHFRGVATVVLKLLNIVRPDALYLGQKDAQQCVVLKEMVRDLHVPTRVVICPTVREPDGLAMSSRNKYLNLRERREAPALYAALKAARKKIRSGEHRAKIILRELRHHIKTHTSGEIDYLACVDPQTLIPMKTIQDRALLAVAVRFRHARLIDNLIVSTYNG